ncbi:MAG: HAMP domain-containing histidine kinase [Chloroflexi bacterium]|nr:HAMP domain-containing histidine kinase [Chloroflexota bacterium]
MIGRFHTLRWRLGLLYVPLIILLLTAAALFTYSQVRLLLTNAVAERVRDRLLGVVYPALQEMPDSAAAGEASLALIAARLAERSDQQVAYLLLDSQGELVGSGGGAGSPHLRQKFPEVPYQDVLGKGEERALVVSVEEDPGTLYVVDLLPITNEAGETVGLIQGVTNLRSVQDALARLRWWLLGMVAAGGLLAGVSAPLLAHLTLAPLRRTGRAAARIAGGDFSRRVPVPPGKDEVGTLSETLNLMQERVRQDLERQEQLQQQMRQFLADASHELRSPLTAIQASTDVLLRGAKDDPVLAEQTLVLVRRETQRLIRLTNDLLALSRLETGTGLELGPVDMNGLCEEVHSAIQFNTEGRKVILRLGQCPPLHGDRDRLSQVLVNLMENGVQHTAPGGEVTVSTRVEGGQCVVTVADNGEGIPPEHLSHLFERFYRVPSSGPRRRDSSGLGLSIARAIVEAHRGSIQVESAPGQGTTFTIRLPLPR